MPLVRAVIQRASEASVVVDGEVVGKLDRPGLVVLVGVTHGDGASESAALAAKIWNLRILRDEKSASDLDAPLLVISQFTLYADIRKGRRPSWGAAAGGDIAEPIIEDFCAHLRRLGATVETGRFGAMMEVHLVNDGPTTILAEISPKDSEV